MSVSFFSLPLGMVAYDKTSFEDDGLNVALETWLGLPVFMSSVVFETDDVKKLLPLDELGSGDEAGFLQKQS